MTNVTTGTTTSAQIVPTFASAIGGKPATCCDARTLHGYLGNARQFADWFKQRIEQYGFEDGKDYAIASQICEAKRGGQNRTDYHLSLNMAKELSMVENNEQGKTARRYFLECERRALEAAGQAVPASHTDTLLPSEQQTLSELVHKRVAGVDAALQGKALAEIWSRLHHKFRVAKYSQLARTQLADAIAYVCAMEVRSLPTAKPQAEGERLSANDWRNLKSVVWHASRGFRYESAWTQAVWFYLRRALGVPAPQQYCVDHLPRLAAELQSVLAATEQVHLMMIRIEKEAARRIFRSGECAEAVVAEIERQAAAQMNEYHQHKLPSYMAKDIAAITQRAPSHYDHGGDETPIAFA